MDIVDRQHKINMKNDEIGTQLLFLFYVCVKVFEQMNQ